MGPRRTLKMIIIETHFCGRNELICSLAATKQNNQTPYFGLVFMLISGENRSVANRRDKFFRHKKPLLDLGNRCALLTGRRAPQSSVHSAGETFAPSEESRPGHIIIIYKNKQAIRACVCVRTHRAVCLHRQDRNLFLYIHL